MRKILYFTVAIFLFLANVAYADIFEIDPIHSHIGFSVKHMVISNVKGKFNKFEGSFELSNNDEFKMANLQIDASSIDTNHLKRDKHLRSPDFLDVEKFPTITFKYKKTLSHNSNNYKVLGDLTIHGVTREVELQGELLGKIKDPWGSYRAGFTGEALIDRKEFGLVWNKVLETGGFVVGDKVKLLIEFEGILKN